MFSCGNTDYGHQCDPLLQEDHWQKLIPRPLTWSQVAPQAIHINMASGSGTAHIHQHGFGWQHRPLILVVHGPQTLTQPRLQWENGPKYGPQWQHGPQTSTWPPVATWSTDTNMASWSWLSAWPLVAAQTTDIHMSLGLQQGLGQWTMDSNMASRSRTDHRGLSRRSSPENELTSCCCSELGGSCSWAVFPGPESVQALGLLDFLSNDVFPRPLQPFIPVTALRL